MTQRQVWSDEDRLIYELGLMKWRRDRCPRLFATDVDEILTGYETHLVVEYYNARPVAVIDYKTHSHWALDASIAVQWKLAFGVGVGMHVVEAYWEAASGRTFQVSDIYLTEVLGDRDFLGIWPDALRSVWRATYTENQFEWWLHELRGLTCCRDRLT